MKTKIWFQQCFQWSSCFLRAQGKITAAALGLLAGSWATYAYTTCFCTTVSLLCPSKQPWFDLNWAATATPACALAASSTWAISPAWVHRDKGMRHSWKLQRSPEPVPAAGERFWRICWAQECRKSPSRNTQKITAIALQQTEYMWYFDLHSALGAVSPCYTWGSWWSLQHKGLVKKLLFSYRGFACLFGEEQQGRQLGVISISVTLL